MTPEQESSSRALEAAADYFHSRKKTHMSWELRQIYNELSELRRDRDRLEFAFTQCDLDYWWQSYSRENTSIAIHTRESMDEAMADREEWLRQHYEKNPHLRRS